MTRTRDAFAVFTAVIFLACGTRPSAGQGAFECPAGSTCWIAETGSYSDDANWESGFVPGLSDSAAIVNGGTAILDDAPDEPLNLYLGRTAFNGIGSLEIRDGGSLVVQELVHVGESQFNAATGLGHLTVLGGGELEAETLTSGGDRGSSIVLGQAASSGIATATINGTATLRRNTRIVGPNVQFAPTFLELVPEHVLTAEITGPEHSTISVFEEATLNGSSVHADFNGYTPSFDDSWDLLDAFGINGEFGQVTASGLPPGAGVFLSQQAGGENGQLVRLSVGTQLSLTVDRRTGQTAIQNRALAESVDFDRYQISSTSAGALDPAAWNSLQDQGEAGWTQSSSSTQLSESNASGSKELSPESLIDLGNPYSFTPDVIGESGPEVAFEYDLAGGETIPGRVEFTGPHNNLVLLVDPDTGGASLQNQSVFDVDIDGYLITSLSGSLDVEGWSSFQEAGQNDWAEANPSAVHLSELNLSSSLSLGAGSAPVTIGSPFDFDAEQAEQDLDFEFHLADGETIVGIVEYGSLAIAPADCNGDGVVDIMDANCTADGQLDAFLAALNPPSLRGDADGDGQVQFEDLVLLSTNFGTPGEYTDADFDKDGTVQFGDLVILSDNFGKIGGAAAVAVPEPAGLNLAALGLLGLLWRRSSRRPLIHRFRAIHHRRQRRVATVNVQHITMALAALTMIGVLANLGSAQTLTPAKQIFVSDSSDRNMVNEDLDPGPLASDGDIVARERADQTQDNLQIRTFIDFDLSSITADEVAIPGWSATLLIDFVTRLNTVNDMSVVVGRVLGSSDPNNSDGSLGDSWTTEPGSLPLFEWGRSNGESAAPEFEDDRFVVVENIKTDPLGTRQADVTGVVANWVNEVHENNGFSVAGDSDQFQGAGLNNARLIVGIPGDFDGNGTIDLADFAILADNFASHLDGPVTSGDMDLDGDVDLDDFGLFKGVFSAVQNQAQSVPEPNVMLLAGWAIVWLFATRRRRGTES